MKKLAFVTLLVEFDDTENYLSSPNTPDDIILFKKKFIRENNHKAMALTETPVEIRGEYAVTPLDCDWDRLDQHILKDAFAKHIKHNKELEG